MRLDTLHLILQLGLLAYDQMWRTLKVEGGGKGREEGRGERGKVGKGKSHLFRRKIFTFLKPASLPAVIFTMTPGRALNQVAALTMPSFARGTKRMATLTRPREGGKRIF